MKTLVGVDKIESSLDDSNTYKKGEIHNERKSD